MALTFFLIAVDATLRVPKTFVRTAAIIFSSATGTCLSAAEWMTTSGVYNPIAFSISESLCTSPRIACRSTLGYFSSNCRFIL